MRAISSLCRRVIARRVLNPYYLSAVSFSTKKKNPLAVQRLTMTEKDIHDIEAILAPLRLDVKKQGEIVRQLKEEKKTRGDSTLDFDLQMAVNELKAKKRILEEKEISLAPKDAQFDRIKLEDLLKQKFVYDQAFAIYGGVQGLFDFGPIGCAIKANMLEAWRDFFVLEEQMCEVDCSILTPEPVLKASGHVDRFTDFMVKDAKTGDCYRADHLVEAVLETKAKDKNTSEEQKEEIRRILAQLDNLRGPELDAVIRKFQMKAPLTNNELTEAQQFNLMFATSIGPSGHIKGYLRPETAQGIFVNFQRLLQFNQGRLPFAAAQIGKSFRNEIAPRSGLLRVREFVMAEIEHFLDPKDKSHPKFGSMANYSLNLLSANAQMEGLSFSAHTLGDAVRDKLIANETLAYFMGRIHKFMVMVGVDPKRLRFRQHMSNEMAHYACDCWDAECLTSYGWIECVGCADRSCYDLTQHTDATGSKLVAEMKLDKPKTVHVVEVIPNKGLLGKTFKKEAGAISNFLVNLSPEAARELVKELETSGKMLVKVNESSVELTKEMVSVKEFDKQVHVDELVPNVIEPSFGIGRIMYCVFEHNFRIRPDDEQRTFLSLPPIIAPYKCSVLPLSKNAEFMPFVKDISSGMVKERVSHRVDDTSGSIGRRYARTDQIGIPYGITIDFDTVNKQPHTATLRERDSMKQIRVPLVELPRLVRDLTEGFTSWHEVATKYPVFEQQETG